VTEEIWAQFHETRLILGPWPGAAERDADAVAVLERVREAAAMFRRVGVAPPLEGEERRIFEAVVRPERARANGDVDAERERLRAEIARAEKMLANDSFVAKAPPDVVAETREKLERYRRELDSLGA
jgi:valyl-tRNA synthetase